MDGIFRGLVPAEGKALLLYEAVLELLKEGRDMKSMKVSDITSRAGIGKGTAYEYFSSKEELIVNAILYDMEQRAAEVEEVVAKVPKFEDKYLFVLNWMEENLTKWCSFGAFMQLQQENYESAADFKQEFRKHAPKENFFMQKFANLVREGREEGVFRDSLPDTAVKCALVAQLVSFLFYLKFRKLEDPMTNEEMKRFSLESFLKIAGKTT